MSSIIQTSTFTGSNNDNININGFGINTTIGNYVIFTCTVIGLATVNTMGTVSDNVGNPYTLVAVSNGNNSTGIFIGQQIASVSESAGGFTIVWGSDYTNQAFIIEYQEVNGIISATPDATGSAHGSSATAAITTTPIRGTDVIVTATTTNSFPFTQNVAGFSGVMDAGPNSGYYMETGTNLSWAGGSTNVSVGLDTTGPWDIAMAAFPTATSPPPLNTMTFTGRLGFNLNAWFRFGPTGSGGPLPMGVGGIIAPFYEYPDSYYTEYSTYAAAHPQTPAVAICNPDNGPIESSGQTGPDAVFTSAIANWVANGVIVAGYIHTDYGTDSYSGKIQEIGFWHSWYPQVKDIFIDEMDNSNTTGPPSYYAGLTAHAHSLGFQTVFGNPGTSTISAYIGSVDNIMIYEGSGLPSIANLQSYTFGTGNRSGFSMIAYSVSDASMSGKQAYFTSAARLVSWMYVTDQSGIGGPPYTQLPQYISGLFAYLS